MNQINLDLESIAEIFNEHFPRGVIEHIDRSDITGFTLEKFEDEAKRFKSIYGPDPNYFVLTMRINYDSGNYTYAALHEFPEDRCSDYILFLRDFNCDKEETGCGRFELDTTRRKYSKKPSVGFIYTEELFLHRGFGTRRLRVMNALSNAIFDLKLHSSSNQSPDAEKIWKKLVENNEATICHEPDDLIRSYIYRFR